MPASRARIPNDAPNARTAIAIGATARIPATNSDRSWRMTAASAIMELASMMMEYSTGMDPLSTELESVDAFVRAVASNVRALRLDAGLTLHDLATAAGLGK